MRIGELILRLDVSVQPESTAQTVLPEPPLTLTLHERISLHIDGTTKTLLKEPQRISEVMISCKYAFTRTCLASSLLLF